MRRHLCSLSLVGLEAGGWEVDPALQMEQKDTSFQNELCPKWTRSAPSSPRCVATANEDPQACCCQPWDHCPDLLTS